LTGAGYALTEYVRPNPDTNDLPVDYYMKVADIVNKFERNEVRATAEYVNKVIAIHGQIAFIHEQDSSAIMLFQNSYSSSSVVCEFEADKARQLQQLQAGQKVTIKGICTGLLMDVVLTRCVMQKD
jgi:hypothetical protein